MPIKYTREQWVQRIKENLRSDLEFVDDGRLIQSTGKVLVRCRICGFIGEQITSDIIRVQKQKLSTCDCRQIEREEIDRQIRKLALNHRWLEPIFEDGLYNTGSKIRMRCRECTVEGKVRCYLLKIDHKPFACLCRERELAKKNRERIERIHVNGCLVECSMTKEITSWNTNSICRFKCADCGEIFSSMVGSVLYGNKGCSCRSNGWTRASYAKCCKNSESRVYMVRCFTAGEEFVKIGIAKTSVAQRFSGQIPYNYEIMREALQKPGGGARTFDLEKKLHRAFKAKFGGYRPQISFSGETECFILTSVEEVKNFFDLVVKGYDNE